MTLLFYLSLFQATTAQSCFQDASVPWKINLQKNHFLR
ncbi:uncharacterized protein METZ01_LOCUS146450 [marine metagenome]|uniref:Uncharacterized protein n=1 Tax=marine metagenome TaxID=408172 RepID=A0A381ZWF1_9ZZZZ